MTPPKPQSPNAAPARSGLGAARALILAPALALLPAAGAHAQTAGLTLTADAQLRYGSFAVFATGARTVSASGAVTDSGIFPVRPGGIGPAQFTVSYDRGTSDTRAITVLYAILLNGSSQVSQNGVTGTLSGFDTDLAGLTLFVPGQLVVATIPNCTTRICASTFHVGARLDVTRSTGGATLSLPLPVTANLIAVN